MIIFLYKKKHNKQLNTSYKDIIQSFILVTIIKGLIIGVYHYETALAVVFVGRFYTHLNYVCSFLWF